MNTSKYVIASAAAAVWLFVYGFVVNAIILADFWAGQSQPGLMRPEAEVPMWAVIASMILQGFALGYIFTRGYEGRGVGEGVRFGALVAWFVIALYLMFYALQPWTGMATVVSMVADGVMYIGAGVVLALLYKPGSTSAANQDAL